MHYNTHRRAFTLIELLVVIAIIALVVALLMPAMNSRRTGGAGLKNSCRNNMKQLVLGLQNHADAYKTMPPLYFSANPALLANPQLNPANAAEYYTWQTRILPFVEEDTLYKKISTSSAKFTQPSTNVQVIGPQATNVSPASIKLTEFLCPSNPLDIKDGTSNYAALSSTRLPLLLNEIKGSDGLPAYKQEPEGMIIPSKTKGGQSMRRMADGTSKTGVLIESVEPDRANWFKPQQSFVVGFLPADSTPIDAAASNYYPYFAAATGVAPKPADWRFNPTAGNRTALAVIVDNTLKPTVPYHPVKGDPLERTWGPSSAHMGGIIIVGMGDGSVQEITPDVDPIIFYSAITARGGEAVQPLGGENP